MGLLSDRWLLLLFASLVDLDCILPRLAQSELPMCKTCFGLLHIESCPLDLLGFYGRCIELEVKLSKFDFVFSQVDCGGCLIQ